MTDYAAAGDGVTDCKAAFKKAIAACTQAGGGRVVVPKGTWLTNGPIHNVPVKDIKIYGKPTLFEPFECTNVLIEDVTILDYPLRKDEMPNSDQPWAQEGYGP